MAINNSCIIISGAPSDDSLTIKKYIKNDSFIICADSGYKFAIDQGIIPNVIIGDFDSSIEPKDLCCKVIKLNKEKAYSDTYHCLEYAIDNNFDSVLIFNAIGSRIDHTYANILLLDYASKMNIKCALINKNNRISIIENETVVKNEFDNFSLFAFLEPCSGVEIIGARYDASFYNESVLNFEPSTQIGLSNYVLDKECLIKIEKGRLLLIESND